MNCLLCGSTQLHDIKGYEKHYLSKCDDCSFVFIKRIPTQVELTEYYSSYSYGKEAFLSPITIKRYHEILDSFEPYRKTNKLLDVGCGLGFFLEQAVKRGWEVYGTEFSETAIEICEKKGINMTAGQCNADDFEDEGFDVITSFEVMEHINNPLEEMGNIHQLLRKNGLFYCTTPNFNSLMRFYLKSDYNAIVYPEHLSYYTPSTFHALMKRTGFLKRSLRTTGISITRLKVSSGKSKQETISKNSDDEKLRRQIEEKWYMGFAKRVLNRVFTWSGTGMTLKGYYAKA